MVRAERPNEESFVGRDKSIRSECREIEGQTAPQPRADNRAQRKVPLVNKRHRREQFSARVRGQPLRARIRSKLAAERKTDWRGNRNTDGSPQENPPSLEPHVEIVERRSLWDKRKYRSEFKALACPQPEG